MKSKFIKIFCAIAMSLLLCIGGSTAFCVGLSQREPSYPAITYREILDNIDFTISEVYDEHSNLLTDNPSEIAIAEWAKEILEIMNEQNLEVHLFDNKRANRHKILEIFRESHANALRNNPNLAAFLNSQEVIDNIVEMLTVANQTSGLVW